MVLKFRWNGKIWQLIQRSNWRHHVEISTTFFESAIKIAWKFIYAGLIYALASDSFSFAVSEKTDNENFPPFGMHFYSNAKEDCIRSSAMSIGKYALLSVVIDTLTLS